MYEIEKDVPIPANTRAAKYPFNQLTEVGDSFFSEVITKKPNDMEDAIRNRKASIHSSKKRYVDKMADPKALRFHIAYDTKDIGGRLAEGVRCWLVEVKKAPETDDDVEDTNDETEE